MANPIDAIVGSVAWECGVPERICSGGWRAGDVEAGLGIGISAVVVVNTNGSPLGSLRTTYIHTRKRDTWHQQ